MRLGKRQTVFKTADSVLRQMYGNTDTRLVLCFPQKMPIFHMIYH